ncbi:hypothetical protein SAMN02927923_02153 [Microvirga guangxiensis]|uniref:Uncharacterized protein n=1 Tax=Microvirga guangxiensis TaxID=549386 RepID=A0A1G5I9C8_9HYPH|nr:hypothetical protein SAMN02927923_02153 [Microvirga guangxiensis]
MRVFTCFYVRQMVYCSSVLNTLILAKIIPAKFRRNLSTGMDCHCGLLD